MTGESLLEILIRRYGVVNVPGPFEKAYEQMVPESIQTASEIMRDWADGKLRKLPEKQEIFVGDGCVYALDDKGEPVIYWTNTRLNPVLKQENYAEASHQIKQTGKYLVKPDDLLLIQKEARKRDGEAKRYRLSRISDVSIRKNSDCFMISYEKHLNEDMKDEQISFAQQICGRGDQYSKVMRKMRKAKINCIFYFLSPGYVKVSAKEGAVALVNNIYIHHGRSYEHDYFCTFNADEGGDLLSYDSILRGLKRSGNDALFLLDFFRKEITGLGEEYIPAAAKDDFNSKIEGIFREAITGLNDDSGKERLVK